MAHNDVGVIRVTTFLVKIFSAVREMMGKMPNVRELSGSRVTENRTYFTFGLLNLRGDLEHFCTIITENNLCA